MGPKFMATLYFDCDGTLEVCGPTNFGPNERRLEITHLRIVDQYGNTLSVPSPPLPIITNAPAPEWEVEVPQAKAILAPGPATGTASGVIVKKDGQAVPVSWVGSFTLADGCAILNSIAQDRVDDWMAYRCSDREYWDDGLD
jgi:hypothetical protein